MSEVRIVAEPRTEFGKGAARRVRRADKVPAVLYGHGEAPRHVSLPGHELMLALKKDSNQLLTLVTDDGDHLALPKAIVRDPIKGFLEHVDLIAVRKGERVDVDIPVVTSGDPAPEVLVEQQMTSITVEADATKLPETLELSVEGLRAGNSLKASDVTLPSGVVLAQSQDPEQVVVAGLGVISEEQLEAELEAAEEELGAGQAGAEAIAAEEAEAAGETPEGDEAADAEGDDKPADEA